MPRAVVTGGAGFLGSHLCERLLVEGLREFVAWSRSQRAEDHVEEAHKELVSRGLVGG